MVRPLAVRSMARFRAVENRVCVARAANTGVTAFIAPSGKVVQQTELFVSGFLVSEVGLGAEPKIYLQMGDIIPGMFAVISILWLVQTRRRFF